MYKHDPLGLIKISLVTLVFMFLITYVYYLGEKIITLNEDINTTMKFSLLQAEKIFNLENKCSESSTQIAAMCQACNEASKLNVEEQDNFPQDLTKQY